MDNRAPGDVLEYGPPPKYYLWKQPKIMIPLALLLAALVAWLFWSFLQAKAQAESFGCRNYLRSIGSGMRLYCTETKGRLPPNMGALRLTEDLTAEVFVCPSSSDRPATDPSPGEQAASINRYDGHCSYYYLGKGLTTDQLTPATVIAYELPGHHVSVTCILYGDWRVVMTPDSTARKIIAEIKAGHNPPRPDMIGP